MLSIVKLVRGGDQRFPIRRIDCTFPRVITWNSGNNEIDLVRTLYDLYQEDALRSVLSSGTAREKVRIPGGGGVTEV